MLTDSSTSAGRAGRDRTGRRPAGRTARPADDPTPLGGDTVDVGARIGWLCRTARLLRGGEPLRRLEDVATASGFGQSRVHRVEVGAQRNAHVLAAYERVLGLPSWSLRAPVDLVCRPHPGSAPKELARLEGPVGVVAMSAMTDHLLDPGRAVDASQWRTWAAAMAGSGGAGLQVGPARSVLARIVDELGRSSGGPAVARGEALTELRRSPYAGLVLEAARRRLEAPSAPGLEALTRAVGAVASADAAVWLLGLLEDDRDHVVAAGAVGLEAMAGTEARTWTKLLPHLVQGLDRADEGTARHGTVTHLLRLTPPEAWEAHGARPLRRIQPPAGPHARRDGRAGPRWSECRAAASAISAGLRLDSEAMVARLLHDVALGSREARAAETAALLTALPEVACAVAVEVAGLAERQEDPVLRERLLRRLPLLTAYGVPGRVRAWLTDAGPVDRRRAALLAAAAAGEALSSEELGDAVDRPDLRDAALTAAGMAGQEVLAGWRDDPRPTVAGTARWWWEHGSRVPC